MTQDEIEGELRGLREQVSQLQQQHERQRKHWFRWGLIAACIGIVLAILSTIIGVITVAGPTPPIATIFQFTALQLLFLLFAFTSAGKPPEGPIGSRLKWGWSD
jgi:heme/copper-type cytochrome/quinol oxidase subunit 4